LTPAKPISYGLSCPAGVPWPTCRRQESRRCERAILIGCSCKAVYSQKKRVCPKCGKPKKDCGTRKHTRYTDTLAEARETELPIRKQLDSRINPAAARRGLTVGELFRRYITLAQHPNAKEYKRSWKKDEQRWRDCLAAAFDNRRIDSISREDAVQLPDGTLNEFEENMMKKQMSDTSTSATAYKDGRYLLLPTAAEEIGIPLRTLRAWREKCRFDSSTAELFARVGMFIFFDLGAWARHLERIQSEATETAHA